MDVLFELERRRKQNMSAKYYRFADGGGGGADPAPADPSPADPPADPQADPPKTFTQEDVNKLISDRLDREQKKWQATLDEKLTEAQKLAKMTADQKAEHEKKKAEEDLQKRIADVTARELKAEAKDTLASKGLPLELAEVLNYADADSCQTSLEAVEKAFGTAVEKALNERLKGSPPKGGTKPAAISKDVFDKMTYMEKYKIKTEQPELYKNLTGGN